MTTTEETEAFREKLRSLSFGRRAPAAKVTEERGEGGRLIARHVEHDDRIDATVFPDVVRYGARVHKTGKRTGQTAEVRVMDRKERGERYGG